MILQLPCAIDIEAGYFSRPLYDYRAHKAFPNMLIIRRYFTIKRHLLDAAARGHVVFHAIIISATAQLAARYIDIRAFNISISPRAIFTGRRDAPEPRRSSSFYDTSQRRHAEYRMIFRADARAHGQELASASLYLPTALALPASSIPHFLSSSDALSILLRRAAMLALRNAKLILISMRRKTTCQQSPPRAPQLPPFERAIIRVGAVFSSIGRLGARRRQQICDAAKHTH